MKLFVTMTIAILISLSAQAEAPKISRAPSAASVELTHLIQKANRGVSGMIGTGQADPGPSGLSDMSKYFEKFDEIVTANSSWEAKKTTAAKFFALRTAVISFNYACASRQPASGHRFGRSNWEAADLIRQFENDFGGIAATETFSTGAINWHSARISNEAGTNGNPTVQAKCGSVDSVKDMRSVMSFSQSEVVQFLSMNAVERRNLINQKAASVPTN